MIKERARGISYRISLVVALPLLVVITGGLIAANSYFSSRRTIATLTESLFDEAAEQTVERSRSHAAQAIPAVDMLAALLADDPTLPDSNTLAKRFLDVLRANPGFAWVSFSDESGSFTGAYRTADGEVRVNQSIIANGKTDLTEHVVSADGTWKPLRHEPNGKYDPRTRPFYTRAVAARSRIWTDPYVFYDQGVPGITCATPVYHGGVLRGVVTVDFDLNVLSKFVSTVHMSDHGTAFVFTREGALLAHPTVRVVNKAGNQGEGEIIQAKSADPVLVDFFAQRPAGGGTLFTFTHGGEKYFGTVSPAQVDDTLTFDVGIVAPESDFLGDVSKTNRTALLISLAAVVISVIIGAVFANRVATPLTAIAEEMERVGTLDLGERPPPKSAFREIAIMGRALVAMKRGLSSFALYVPRDLVHTLIASGEEAKLGGKPKELTIFFSDLAGFTTLSESMEPQALVALLAGYFDAMTSAIGKKQGTVDKFIGDAIMAFWNAPLDVKDHAVLGCRAALECQATLAKMRASDPALAGLNQRIGLSTGTVVVGNIGASDRMNYTVMGDTANLASRLEGLNKAYGTRIMASETTFAKAKHAILGRPIDLVAVKGKAKGVRVYELLAEIEQATDAQKRVAALSEEALDSYLARDFDRAAKRWQDVIDLLPNDTVATMMRDRARELATEPPPSDWDGTQIMHEK